MTAKTHVYLDDGSRDHHNEGRCRTCCTPRRNSVHELPDVQEATDEHRRRVGESDISNEDD